MFVDTRKMTVGNCLHGALEGRYGKIEDYD